MPFGGIGSFDFSIKSYNEVIFISLIGITGIIAGSLLGDIHNKRTYISSKLCLKEKINRYYFCCWIILTYAVDLLLFYYGYGQINLDKELPYHLGGLIYYYRMITVPFISFILFDIAVNNKSKTDVKYFLIAILVGSVICQFASLSRGPMIARMLPILLYMLFYDQQHILGTKKQKICIVILILFLILLASPLVTIFRFIVWDVTSSNSFLDNISELINIASSSSGLSIESAVSLLISRATGMQELMAVYGAEGRIEYGLSLFIKLLFDSVYVTDFYNAEVLVDSYYSYSAAASPGLFGFLYFSGSVFVVFFVSLFGSFAIIEIGAYFYNRGFRTAGYGISFTFITLFWAGGMVQAGISMIILFLSWRSLKYIIYLKQRTSTVMVCEEISQLS